jgi:hypothetical protein
MRRCDRRRRRLLRCCPMQTSSAEVRSPLWPARKVSSICANGMRRVWKSEKLATAGPLWRYFRVERFLGSLESGTLYFAAAREFEDRFEGAVAIQMEDRPARASCGKHEDVDRAFEELRRLTKVSCWHRAEYESDAMWKLYAAERKGLAVRTTADRLRSGLRPFRLAPTYGEEVPWCGSVKYVDLSAVSLRAGMEERFFYKHMAFAWEREFRIAISLTMAQAFGVPVPELGINVHFDPAEVIEAIYLGPHLSDEDRRRIIEGCRAAGLSLEPVRSTLLGHPRYV